MTAKQTGDEGKEQKLQSRGEVTTSSQADQRWGPAVFLPLKCPPWGRAPQSLQLFKPLFLAEILSTWLPLPVLAPTLTTRSLGQDRSWEGVAGSRVALVAHPPPKPKLHLTSHSGSEVRRTPAHPWTPSNHGARTTLLLLGAPRLSALSFPREAQLKGTLEIA